MKKTPVILDTDIGSDIDDTWAIAFMLRRPEIEVKLITTATDNTAWRAELAAEILEVAGRADIPVGIGFNPANAAGRGWQRTFRPGYTLADYPGTVHKDGVDALISTVMNAPEPVTIVCIGPLTNIGEALRREPRIASRARFVGMHGSLRAAEDGRRMVVAEYNVVRDPAAAKTVFTAPWDITITPLDTCGVVRLSGAAFDGLSESRDPLVRLCMHGHWTYMNSNEGVARSSVGRTSILFDTVAVYLAFAREFTAIERLGVTVTDDGYTLIDAAGKQMDCATQWSDLEGYKRFLCKSLEARDR
ncbi:nucleoside hydrolase [bacterium]|nr:nucleoside hydrolase [bacterium]